MGAHRRGGGAGADLVTRSELQALLPVRFPCLADVLLAVERTRRVTPAIDHLVPDAGSHDLCACAGTSRDLPPRLRFPDLTVNDGSFATSAASRTPADAAVVLDGRSVLGRPTRVPRNLGFLVPGVGSTTAASTEPLLSAVLSDSRPSSSLSERPVELA